MNRKLTLITGGARSGKSSLAERLAMQGERVLFVATAEALDDDMRSRIAAHQASRPAEWHTLEEPRNLPGAIGERIRGSSAATDECGHNTIDSISTGVGRTDSDTSESDTVKCDASQSDATVCDAAKYDTIVVDCLTMWVSNLLLQYEADNDCEARITGAARELLNVYAESEAQWIIVTNEVGLGVVPPSLLGRAYRDALGRVNSLVASRADKVYLMAAGLVIDLRALGARHINDIGDTPSMGIINSG